MENKNKKIELLMELLQKSEEHLVSAQKELEKAEPLIEELANKEWKKKAKELAEKMGWEMSHTIEGYRAIRGYLDGNA